MKKIISLIMVVAMLLSVMVLVIPTSASKEMSDATAEKIDYIDALYFEKAPSIDGVVTETEWGDVSFTVDATDCAVAGDSERYTRFLFWRTGTESDYNTWSYDVWFRWDENYFYVAAKVYDPDIYQLKFGSNNTWNGDAIQMRIDTAGPNAVTGGDDFSVNENYSKPWSSQNVPDFQFGYCQIAGGFSEAWEAVANKGMTSFSKNPLGSALCVVAPCGSSYSSDTQSGITTYEIGIPWAYILNDEKDNDGNQLTALTYTKYTGGRNGNRAGGVGREFGISMVNLDDGNNPDAGYDAWMAWGSGICGDHQTLGAATCTGSNSVMLSEEKVSQGDYPKQDPTSLLDATFSTANWDKPGVFYDYLADDFEKANPIKYNELSVLTYDDDPDADRCVFGSDNYQGSVKNIGGEHQNVLDYSWTKESGNQFYCDTRDGDIAYEFPTSFTFEFDIIVTGTEVVDPNHDSRLYNWFGGQDKISFINQYNFNERMFKITPAYNSNDVIASQPYSMKINNWYTWRFQYDDESCTARFWLDDKSTTDDDGDGWGEMIFNVRWRYFNYADTTETVMPFQFHNVQVQFDNVKIYNFGSMGEVAVAEEGSESQGTGTGAGTTTTTQTGGGEVAIDTNKVYKKDGNWHVPVFAKSEYATATQLAFTLDYDPAKSEFAGVEGLADGTYTVIETEKGKVQVVIKDFSAVKALKAGDKFFEFLLKALDDNAGAADLGLKLSDSYVYTVTTGDAMTFIVIGGVFAIATATAVLFVRRKKEEE